MQDIYLLQVVGKMKLSFCVGLFFLSVLSFNIRCYIHSAFCFLGDSPAAFSLPTSGFSS